MILRALIALVLAGAAVASHAHSASDAYLSLGAPSRSPSATIVDGQWDIALRDLEFVLRLDDDGDGALTWGEVRKREADIERYAYERLRADGDGTACRMEPGRMAIADRADGAYANLAFRVICPGAPKKVTLDYRLLFEVDPSHRGILVFRSRGGSATALISPDKPRVGLTMP